MSAEKGLVPRLRFPEFREAREWEPRKIGDICVTFSGGTPSTTRKEFYGGDIPFIRSAEIGAKQTELFITKTGLASSSAKLAEKGDVLVALYGANSGDVALAKINGAINQAILCLRTFSSNAFVYHYLTLLKEWIVMTHLQGGQGNLSGEIVKSILLFIPYPEEQRKIAACISSLDALIAAQADKLDALKTHKKGLMQQLFPGEGETVPRLRFPEFREVREWEQKKLSDLFSFRNGLNADKEKYGKGHKYISVLDIISGKPITYDSIHSSVEITDKELELFKVEYGDILFQRSSETQDEAGQASVYLDRKKPAIFGGFVIRGKRISDYQPLFMSALLASAHVRKAISS
ncbi:MAG: restriction endonuclease subunit S, partial [Lamprobacter sp.]|uniref:restriction endonuclease subunit S n=1 Tax=Lamprobacter sp. TaxID=3100796 RepID=UPI002B2584EB